MQSALIAAVVVAAWTAGICRADLLADFEKEYPAATAKLEEAYRHVRMEAESEGHYQKRLTEWTRINHVELVRDGEMFREVMTTVKSTDEGWPVGSVIVNGDTETLRYFCYKEGPAGVYKFTNMEAKTGGADMTESATAAYWPGGHGLLDLLKSGERDPVAVTHATFDGKEAIVVMSAVHYEQLNQKKVMVQHFYFQPGTWASMGYLWYRGPLTITKKVEYEERKEGEEFPRVKRVEGYEEDSRNPGVRIQYYSSDVKMLRFEKPEAGELELAGLKRFGIVKVPTEEELKAQLAEEEKQKEHPATAPAQTQP